MSARSGFGSPDGSCGMLVMGHKIGGRATTGNPGDGALAEEGKANLTALPRPYGGTGTVRGDERGRFRLGTAGANSPVQDACCPGHGRLRREARRLKPIVRTVNGTGPGHV